jgi:hypothetical protein
MRDEISFSEVNKKEIESLRNTIIEAFCETQPPAKDDLVEHECEECRGVRKAFINIKWQNASDKLLEDNYDKIPLFTPLAFNYFLPAFLLYALGNADDEFSETSDFTLYALTPGKNWKDENGRISAYWIEKFRFFTDAQMNAVYRFLELAGRNPAYADQITSIERAFDRLKAIRAAGGK